MKDSRFPDVPGGYPFPALELEVLEEWKRGRIFEQSLSKPAPAGDFVFFEGPPTANNGAGAITVSGPNRTESPTGCRRGGVVWVVAEVPYLRTEG